MEELKQQALVGIADIIQKGLDQAPAYVSDMVERYSKFFITAHGIGIGIGVLLIIISILLIRKGDPEYEDGLIALGVSLIICAIPLIIGCSIGLIKGLYIPEVVLIQHL